MTGCRSNVDRVQNYLSKGEYNRAIQRVDNLKRDEEINEADDLIKNEIENLKNKYISGEIDGTLAISEIEKLRSSNRTDINNALEAAKENIHMRMNSKKAFDDGIKFEDEGNYKDALESYHLVSEYDEDNYKNAADRIEALIIKLSKEQILTVEETHVIVTSATHKSLYPDQLQIIFRNNGNANITKFRVTIFGYDTDGNPVKIDNGTDKSYMFIGLGEGVTIRPGQLWGHEYGWSVDNDNIKRIEAYVESAEYEDGTVWENPLYTEFIRNHKIE